MGDGERHSLYAYQIVMYFIMCMGDMTEKTKSVPHNPTLPYWEFRKLTGYPVEI